MITILSFYKIQKLKKLKSLKKLLFKKVSYLSIKGLIILSPEGINGTLAGQKKSILKMKNILKRQFNFVKFDSSNYSTSKFQPFHQAKVKIKKNMT